MLSILGSLIGFGSSIVPEVLGFFKQSQANKQELAMLEARAKYAESLSELKIEELDAQADIAETKGIYEHDRSLTSDGFVSQLRASVRPVITYLFFTLFATVKISSLVAIMSQEGATFTTSIMIVWDSETQAIFAAIVSFWFGSRAYSKAKEKKNG
jgi:hypothetical protein|tara:strand:- start:96 stop:563 length:468 start_codon:yes stop_codon:yes gene_type:complete